MNYKKALFPFFILFAGITVMYFSRVPDNFSDQQQVRAPRVGFRAPSFAGKLLGGGALTDADTTNTPIVLNIWASWCPPCRAEMPTLEKMSQKYSLAGVRFIGINSTIQDTPAKAQDFLEKNGITFSQVMDTDGSITQAYGVSSLPSTYFIAPNGKITQVVIGGPISEASLITNIERMLQEAP